MAQKVLLIDDSMFVGSYLCKNLSETGYEVTMLSSSSTRPYLPAVEFLVADRNTEEFFILLKDRNFDVVIDTCLNDREQAIIMEKLFRAGFTSRFIFFSSISVFGINATWNLPLKADSPMLPDSEEAVAKKDVQNILEGTAKDIGMSMYTCYLPHLFGPRSNIVYEMVPFQLLMHDRPILLEAHGQYLLANGYVENIVEAISCMVRTSKKTIQSWMVAGEGLVTQKEWVNFMGNFLGMEPQYYHLSKKIKQGLFDTEQMSWKWPYLNKHVVLDLEPLKNDFNFKTKLSIFDGLEKTLIWIQNKKIEDTFNTVQWDLSVVEKFYKDFKEFEIPEANH
ncbi:NAD-dependent epimerase/dehydratase family protein [Candidatus Riflebacteria bacterium]